MRQHGGIAIATAALMPPPFPLKLFVITAGVFRFSAVRFAIAIATARALRYVAEGYLASRYGASAAAIIGSDYLYILGGPIVVVIVFFLIRILRRRILSS